MSQLKETCNLLDDTLIEYFETVELVHQKQEELDNCMKDGFLLMAKVSGLISYLFKQQKFKILQGNSDDQFLVANVSQLKLQSPLCY